MFTISVCMIVRDEELTLGRILSCAKQFADEIVVVDTGSKDSTIKIAKEHTNKVYKFKWCDDFSKARNYSVSKATKDYFMWLDADDIISDENIRKINYLKNTRKPADVYMFKYIMGYDENNRPTLEFYRERLLKRANNYKFEGFLHEAIPPSGLVEYVNIAIQHKKEVVHNPRRNLDIFERHIKKKTKFAPRDVYYYARELYYHQQYNKAIDELHKYFQMTDTYIPNIIDAYIIIFECFKAKDDYASCNKHLLECTQKYPPTSEICCKLAESFEKIGNPSLAIFWYNTALTCEHMQGCFYNKDYSDFIPLVELCRLTYFTDKKLSEKYHQRAKKIKPNHPSIIYNDKLFL